MVILMNNRPEQITKIENIVPYLRDVLKYELLDFEVPGKYKDHKVIILVLEEKDGQDVQTE